jgi:glyoxylase I family protein
MSASIRPGPIHHLRLTVSDVARSREFYTSVLGFGVAMEAPPPPDHPSHALVAEALQGGVVLIHGDVLFGLRPSGADRAGGGAPFDEHRVGLDHLSFSVASRAALDDAVRLLDARGVPHGEPKDLPDFGITVLAFRDPDNVQLELTAPYS